MRFLSKGVLRMSSTRIQSQFLKGNLEDDNTKTGEILLKEGLKYYQKAKQYFDNPISYEPRAKNLLRKSLLFFSAAENMGNFKAKEWSLEAKNYYNTKSLLEDEYVMVSSPDIKSEHHKDSEFIAAKLYKDCKINFISNWVKNPVCRIEIPRELHQSLISLS
jgi:hypothetical protein